MTLPFVSEPHQSLPWAAVACGPPSVGVEKTLSLELVKMCLRVHSTQDSRPQFLSLRLHQPSLVPSLALFSHRSMELTRELTPAAGGQGGAYRTGSHLHIPESLSELSRVS